MKKKDANKDFIEVPEVKDVNRLAGKKCNSLIICFKLGRLKSLIFAK